MWQILKKLILDLILSDILSGIARSFTANTKNWKHCSRILYWLLFGRIPIGVYLSLSRFEQYGFKVFITQYDKLSREYENAFASTNGDLPSCN